MTRRPVGEMAQRIATGYHDVWSIGPFRRPSTALRRVAPWLRMMEKADSPGRGYIASVEDVRLVLIGQTWWVEVQFDNTSVLELLPKNDEVLP